MIGNTIYLNNITSAHTVYMIKTLLVDYVGVPEDQQRLLFGRNIMENDNILEVYNVNDQFILVVVRIMRDGLRTRCTRGLTPALIDASSKFENTSEYLLQKLPKRPRFFRRLLTLFFNKKH